MTEEKTKGPTQILRPAIYRFGKKPAKTEEQKEKRDVKEEG